jgi:hypothetical protein
VGGGGGEREVGVDLVDAADVDAGQVGGRGDGGEEFALAVGGADVIGREAGLAGEGVGGVAAYAEAGGQAEAGGGGDLGHVLDVEDAGGVEVALGVVDAEVGSLVALEGELDALAGDEAGLEDLATVGGELDLVEGEAGVGKLGADLGGEGAAGAAGGLKGNGDGAGILLGLEGDLVGEVLGQDVCSGWSTVGKMGLEWWEENALCGKAGCLPCLQLH